MYFYIIQIFYLAVSESYESGHEMTEEEIAEKLLENAEVIENNGKNVIGYIINI